MRDGTLSKRDIASATLLRVAVAAAFVVALLAAWYVARILLLVFGAVLFALFFSGVARALSGLTGWPYRACLAISMFVLVGVASLTAWLRAPAVFDQIEQMQRHLPEAVERVRDSVSQLPFGKQLARNLQDPGSLLPETAASPHTVFSLTASTIAYGILVLFVTIYLAAQPGYYRRGVLLLIPPGARTRAGELLLVIGDKLWWWLIARFAAMTVVGLLVAAGLSLLGIPLAMTLGLIAAVLDFIPNFGPIIAAVPGILLGLLQGPEQALYVALLYWGIQIVEGYIVTPWFQKRAIDMPPALIVIAQLAFGALFGTIGLVFATPLTAVLILLTNELYVEECS